MAASSNRKAPITVDTNILVLLPLSRDSVAKLSLRLRLNRDSVDQDYDSRGTVDDGSAGSRARSILLFV